MYPGAGGGAGGDGGREALLLGKGRAGFAGRTAVGMRRKKSFDYVL